jgi:exopolysaccharide biosynthesis polyprenyl glycosylphosphotransferase
MREFVEQPSFLEEVKNQICLYSLVSRYEKLKAGKLPWEDRVLSYVDSIKNYSIRTSLDILRVSAIASWRKFVKRCLDLVVSVVGIVVAFPVMAVIALLVKLDSRGPVFYKQTRVGMKGKLFNMLKFRTMAQDAEETTGPMWAQMNDGRVTRLGRFLRRTHFDELPQFFNVLGGEMSLVGPRPERPHFVKQLRKAIPHYDRRLCVKPGVTGLAQIKRKYDESVSDVKKKVRYDVLYVRKMCPVLDLMVIALTFKSVLLGTGR